MPSHDRVRLHEHQRRSPVGPDSGDGNPEQSVAREEARAPGRAFHRCQLLAQREVLEDQFPIAAERHCQYAASRDEQL